MLSYRDIQIALTSKQLSFILYQNATNIKQNNKYVFKTFFAIIDNIYIHLIQIILHGNRTLRYFMCISTTALSPSKLKRVIFLAVSLNKLFLYDLITNVTKQVTRNTLYWVFPVCFVHCLIKIHFKCRGCSVLVETHF